MESEFEMDVRCFLAREPFCLRSVPKEKLDVFCTALTHDSYSNEQKDANPPRIVESYERLEFLGDSILEFIACEHIFNEKRDLDEEEMTLYKIDKVENKNLSRRVLSYGLDIDPLMRVGGGHKGNRKSNEIVENMRSDVFEALVAACYLTYGMDLARSVVTKVILEQKLN